MFYRCPRLFHYLTAACLMFSCCLRFFSHALSWIVIWVCGTLTVHLLLRYQAPLIYGAEAAKNVVLSYTVRCQSMLNPSIENPWHHTTSASGQGCTWEGGVNVDEALKVKSYAG